MYLLNLVMVISTIYLSTPTPIFYTIGKDTIGKGLIDYLNFVQFEEKIPLPPLPPTPTSTFSVTMHVTS